MRLSSCTVTATATVARALSITFLLLLIHPSFSTTSQVYKGQQTIGHTDIPTLVHSPEWQPFYNRLLSTPTLADLLSSSALASRNLQSEVNELNTPCNEVLDTISLSDLVTIMTSIVNVLAPSGSVQSLYLKSLLVDNLKTGIQVIQVCGSCTDSIPNLEKHQDYCGPNDYGNDQLHSGLLLIPTQPDPSNNATHNKNDTILPGTHIGYVYTRGTTLSLQAEPSLLWMGRQDTHPINWIYMALASAQSVVFLAPHYMGYGKSADLYKAYIIRKGYETSVIPLWYQSQTLVQDLSGGCAALGNAAIVAGYSEGGYSSVVVANALYQNAGVDIIQVQTGAGPYKVSSAALMGIFQSILNGNYPNDGLIILGLLGTSYSSTYPNLANYNTSQDLLSSINGIRDLVVDAITGIADPQVVDPLLGNLTQTSILDLLRPAFVAAMEQFLANGVLDPCSNNTTNIDLVDLEIDQLCAALVENDLTAILEEQIQYPVEFCQSPEDEIVAASNLPDNLNSSPYFSQVGGVTGDHFTAGETCFVHVLSSARTMAPTLATYSVPALHNQECNASSLDGGDGSLATPTMAPNSPPTADPSSSSASSSSVQATMIGKLLLLLFVLAAFITLPLVVLLYE